MYHPKTVYGCIIKAQHKRAIASSTDAIISEVAVQMFELLYLLFHYGYRNGISTAEYEDAVMYNASTYGITEEQVMDFGCRVLDTIDQEKITQALLVLGRIGE